ncbi:MULTISPECIES: phage major capsid protein [unclassified Kitasatospora]|uniref:phage major capsid protein n=1 Tax=unclassified Kitasatospora TaxID=2633591 RepID=UPI002472FEC5|nr:MULTISPECIES: phage major capsid protein [unclassified Kitasatospora]MDH6123866.1 HK97 family phage major capsid protein [Kitasatospora sp. GP82]MDH6576035.1 HK97 family phage major capsid protein [Kitasatospora sp. MAP5-34]
MNKREAVADILAKRSAKNEELTKLLDAAKGESRGLSETESSTFDALETEVRELDARAKELDEQIRADDAAAEMAKRYAPSPSGFQVTEPEIYRSGLGGRSYFRDLHMARNKGDRDAMDRLVRNDRGRALEARALTTVNGAGGEFVPPRWLEDQFVKLARPGRITANLTPTFPLPPGTDSINIPKINTGTQVATQQTQNTGVQQTDLTTTSVNSGITTVAGGQTVSLQLIEQSPLNIDDVILSDLAAAYAVQLNQLVLSGTGSNGQPTGLLTLAGTNAITFTSASPTLGLLYSKLAGAIQSVHTNRYLPPDTIIMHPSRWAWCLASLDGQNRPLVVPDTAGPMNAMANAGAVASQGYVGHIMGLPVYVDATIPTNLGAGTNQDVIIVARMADLILWEGNVKAEAFAQTFANQLSVFVRLYNYMSFQAARYPKSISTINGTGLTAPSF